jgi:hypothetical protein
MASRRAGGRLTPAFHIMVAAYTVEGDSFRADKPKLWSEGRFMLRPGQRSASRRRNSRPFPADPFSG